METAARLAVTTTKVVEKLIGKKLRCSE